MSDSEPEGDKFKVYLTATIDRDAVVAALYKDVDEESVAEETFVFESLHGHTTQQVVRHHRDSGSKEEDVHPKMFLVFDSDDLEERGALFVSLDEYHGFDDAVRLMPDDANMSICSLSIANDDWHTLREDLPDEKTETAPVDWFALYNLLPNGQQARFDDAALAMNLGIQEVGVGDPGEDLNMDGLRKIYRDVSPDIRDVGRIRDGHAAYADENGLDADRFAVIDGQYEDDGVLIAQVQPNQD